MKTKLFVSTIMLLTILITACTSSQGLPKDTQPALTLSTPGSINPFTIDYGIALIVENNSYDTIVINPGDTVVSVRNESNWMPVDSFINYSGYLLIPKNQGKGENTSLVTVSPKILSDKPATFRILIKGTDQSTNQKVEAQIEVILYP